VELPEELRLSLLDRGCRGDGLSATCTTVGLAVMGEMITAEMAAKVGSPKHAKLAQRQGNWHAGPQLRAARLSSPPRRELR
jgi:hypothetical protein